MIEKKATVHWEGRGKAGSGQISTETGALQAIRMALRAASKAIDAGTNPEELLGAAHAACFTMAFSFMCDKAGFATNAVDAQGRVRLVQQGDGFLIDRIALDAGRHHSGHRRGEVPGARAGREKASARCRKRSPAFPRSR